MNIVMVFAVGVFQMVRFTVCVCVCVCVCVLEPIQFIIPVIVMAGAIRIMVKN